MNSVIRIGICDIDILPVFSDVCVAGRFCQSVLDC